MDTTSTAPAAALPATALPVGADAAMWQDIAGASMEADFESDLAHALALSQEEARGSPADGSGGWSPSALAVGAGLSTPASDDDQLAAALAASLAPPACLESISGAPGGSEDDELARALALSMGERPPRAEDTRGTAVEAQYGIAVGELMSMGFEKASVLQALEASGGDQEAAANILLG